MKKIFTWILIFCFVTIMPVKANANTTEYRNNTKLADIKANLDEYMEKVHPDLKPETQEYYDFVSEQLISGTDKVLASSPDYKFIHAYLTEYVIEYQNYLFDQNVAVNNMLENISETDFAYSSGLCTEYDGIGVRFNLSDDFLNQTIEDLTAKHSDNSALSNENEITPYSGSYSASSAVAYAHRYSKSSNSYYPYFPTGDCTNFVSQCIYAGGISMDGSSSASGIKDSTTKWYYNQAGSSYAATTSWVRAADFYTYMYNHASGRRAVANAYSVYLYSSVGDVVQLRDSLTGGIYHSVIISERQNSTAYFCAHTHNRDGINDGDDANVRVAFDDSANTYMIFKF